MVGNIGGQLGTKVVISALEMLALYMRFNGTGIWSGETTWGCASDFLKMLPKFKMAARGQLQKMLWA